MALDILEMKLVKKQRSVIGYSKICSLNCPDFIWIQNNPLPFFSWFLQTICEIACIFVFKIITKTTDL